MVTTVQMDFHAARISNVFSPNRGIPRDELNSFFHFFDDLIRLQRADQNIEHTKFTPNNVYNLLGALATQNRELAYSVARMNGETRPEDRIYRQPEDANVDRVVRKLLNIFPESEIQMAFDSLVQIIRMSTKANDDPRQRLYLHLDPGIVGYVERYREVGVSGFEIPN